MKVEETLSDGVLTITMNRPEVLNALDEETKAGLLEAFRRADGDTAVRAVVLEGAGRAFSAGEDLKDHRGGGAASIGRSLRQGYHPLILLIRGLSKPTIAKVHGVAAGSGFSLALAADVRIGSAKARFIAAFSKLGLAPDAGLGSFLPHAVGLGRALDIAFTARPVEAEEAERVGLLTRLVPEEELDGAVRSYARALAEGPTRAYFLTRQVMQRSFEVPLGELLAYEAQAQESLGRSEDFREGLAAFEDKRPPRFRGK